MNDPIHTVLEYGPIVAGDEDLGILITVNGAYFNVWVGEFWREGGWSSWSNTEAYDMRSRVIDRHESEQPSDGLYGLHITDVMDAAAELLNTLITGEEEE